MSNFTNVASNLVSNLLSTKTYFITLRNSLLIIIIGIVSGCGGESKTANTPNTPNNQSNNNLTASPAPILNSQNNSPSPSGAIAPTPKGTNQQNSVLNSSPSSGLAEVKIDKLETYNHPNGLFSLEVPTGWTKQNVNKSNEIVASWTNPAQNAQILVDIFEVEVEVTPTQAELGEALKELVTNSFGKQPKFTVSNPETQPDGAVRLEYSYEVVLEGQSIIIVDNSLIEQKGNKVMVFSIALPQTQVARLKASMDKIIASRQINPQVKIAEGNN
ncbi:MAG: hypothetical protein HC916_11045 [Coleofasciculaceae cyanobacterium SM2_1_6]|nr:hypothetical protein [Coleofasciculaceae cyanobacterium SM2_1_6]